MAQVVQQVKFQAAMAHFVHLEALNLAVLQQDLHLHHHPGKYHALFQQVVHAVYLVLLIHLLIQIHVLPAA